ncbi:MAG: hypothetical protein JNL73_08400 [Anaerolineales bacterium]|nr:hypothetical protein [Anaerolineales bacterium]
MADERELLKEGIASAKAGDHAHALVVLQEVVEHFPRSIEGWLWLGLVVEEPGDAEECFQRVLVLDPKHKQAREYLEALKQGHAPEMPAPTPAPPPAPPSELDRFRQSLGVAQAGAEAAPLPAARLIKAVDKPPAHVAPKPKAQPKPARRTPGRLKLPHLRLSTGQAIGAGLLGVWAMALVCGAPVLFLMVQISGGASAVAVATLIPSPTVDASTPVAAAATSEPTQALSVPTLEAVVTPVAPSAAPAEVEPALAAGRWLIQQQRYAEARAALLPIVAAAPAQAEARALLAHADIGALIEVYDAEPDGLTPNTARKDADAAIALDPTQGDLYLLRAFADAEAVRRSADAQTRETLAADARANLEAANRLGVSGSAFGAWLPLLQARVGLCEDGYKTATQALAVGGRLTRERAWLQYGAALNAYCRGRFDETGAYARQAVETLGGDFPQARELEILSLHARKRTSEALQKVEAWLADDLTESTPRLALRGFLRYESGDREHAESDLALAESLGGPRSAWLGYTRGRLTVDFGSETGWDVVRAALVAVDPALGWLRERWAVALAEAGQDPAPVVAAVTTPELVLPTVVLNGAPPPNPGLVTPLEAGHGPLTVGQTGTVLHFQAAAPIGFVEVSEVRVAVLSLEPGATANRIEVSAWDQSTGRWVATSLGDDGTALFKQPARFVSAEGDVYVSVRTLVAERWGLRRLALTITGTLNDGQTAQIGRDPAAPGDVSALAPLEQAAALVAADELERAAATLMQALEAADEPAARAAVLDQLARVALLRGDPTGAAEHMIAALGVETLPERHFVLGLALDLSGDTSGARREYELAVAPGNPLPTVSRGLAEGRIQQMTR